MEITEIKSLLVKAMSLDKIYISGDTSCLQIIAVSEEFTNMNQIQRQQKILMPLAEHIANNRIHAVSIKAYSLEEWKNHCKWNTIKDQY